MLPAFVERLVLIYIYLFIFTYLFIHIKQATVPQFKQVALLKITGCNNILVHFTSYSHTIINDLTNRYNILQWE